MLKHIKSSGNCTDDAVTCSCRKCGKGNVCDVCHKHDEPRGSCSECPPCPKCDRDAAQEAREG